MATASTLSLLSNPSSFGVASDSGVLTGATPNTFGAINAPTNTSTQPISLLTDQSTLPQSLAATNSPNSNSALIVPDRNDIADTTSSPSSSNPFAPITQPDYNANSMLVISPNSASGSTQLPAGTGAILGDGTPAASTDSLDGSVDFADQFNASVGSSTSQSELNSFLGVSAAAPLDVGSLQSPSSIFTSPLTSLSSALGSLSAISGTASGADVWDRVKLRFLPAHPFASYPGIMNPLAQTGGMVWLFKPEVSIAENVDYESVSLVHALNEVHSFTSNKSQSISVSGQFVSQELSEAMYAMAAIHFMRTVCKMSFGVASAVPIGAPPPILYLSGYGQEMMNDLPVIVTSFSQELPSDVDYIRIPSGPAAGTKIPVAFTLTANLTVQRSPNSMRSFNLSTYAASGQANFW